ncbi:MBL fold metallo-hydrolase [Frankia sp. Ag45/Mut15]|uniref:MBL fold metallo-hydrolase n=1 Tax=Frankia umida TaxID=573489 RepID=A0ABT0JV34_9ACTN|nr:MBL fold metallo-hydrolase [Frankia umida]MCK9875408.1 MBL fold metallo-hydrolase [Frankia umida]
MTTMPDASPNAPTPRTPTSDTSATSTRSAPSAPAPRTSTSGISTQPGTAAVPVQRRALPPVEQIRPGLWSVPVPLPVRRPAYMFVYVFETAVGPYLVDAGWDHDEAFAALEAGLATIGTSVAQVRGILVTHAHPDHYGLAHRVRAASGAWIALHRLEAAALHHSEMIRDAELAAMLVDAGAPDDVTAELLARDPLPIATVRPPDLLISDGDRLDVPGWSLHALWTPGHTPGHLCFWESEQRLLVSGDHVLPATIISTPLPSPTNPDPLGDHLRSLSRLRGLGADLVLPAHDHRITDLDQRLLELEACHRARMTELVEGLRAGVGTVWELASLVSWHRPFTELRAIAMQIAVQDTLSYLAALAATGIATVEDATPTRWRLVT